MSAILLAATGAAVWQAIATVGGARVSPKGQLTLLLPAELSGVKIEDLPLGPDEYVDGLAKEKMDYDDVVYRSYTTSQGAFAVYIGYWALGKRSPSHVAAHIPDRCWTLAGMTCLDRKADYVVRLGGFELAPGYWRRFRAPGAGEIETVFWHLVGDDFYDYGGRLHEYTPPAQRVMAVVRDVFSRRGDQYFIRVTSQRSLDDFRNDPAFIAVMKKVAQLGLRKKV